jgi:hypothetical protein
MKEKHMCLQCLESYMTADGLLVHIKYFHPELMKCFVNLSIGESCLVYRHID